MNFTVYLDKTLSEKVNARLKRDVKISILCRWLLMGAVLTPKELSKICHANDEEARAVASFLQSALSKIFDATKDATKEGESEKE